MKTIIVKIDKDCYTGAGGGKEAYGCFLAGAYDTYI